MLRLKINNQSQSRGVIVAGELGYYNSRQNTCTYINTCTQIIKKNNYLLDCQPGFCGTHWEKLDVY